MYGSESTRTEWFGAKRSNSNRCSVAAVRSPSIGCWVTTSSMVSTGGSVTVTVSVVDSVVVDAVSVEVVDGDAVVNPSFWREPEFSPRVTLPLHPIPTRQESAAQRAMRVLFTVLPSLMGLPLSGWVILGY